MNLSERKLSEISALDSEAKYSMLFENSADGILIADIETRKLKHANPAGCRMFGYADEELRTMCVADIHPKDTLPHVVAEFEALARGEKTLATDIPCLRKDGTIFYADINTTKIPVPIDGRACIVGFFRDVTELKRAKDDLLNTNIWLQKSLDELALTQQKVIQQERLSALGQMASGIVHDFNNVLMPILGFSELLLSNPSALDDRKESRHMIGMILSAGKDARQIVRRLSAFYREEEDTDYKMVDISRIVESSISLTMPKWKEELNAKGITIEMVTEFNSVPQIRGNESEIREALTNLIFNAVDAMPNGGVITFRIFLKNDISIVLEVTDTGIGMGQETLQHCLEPFFTTKGQGTGLGLSMTYGIVERHEGVVEIESKPNAGTTIRMLFPVPFETREINKELEEISKPLPPLRILVIDDEVRVRDLIARLLKTDAHHVEVAAGGREGLEMLLRGYFDLVITDRAMPIMSGDEVAKETHKLRPGTPIIMLTGFGNIMKNSNECPPGVTRVMSKPLTSKDLRLVMASVMKEPIENKL